MANWFDAFLVILGVVDIADSRLISCNVVCLVQLQTSDMLETFRADQVSSLSGEDGNMLLKVMRALKSLRALRIVSSFAKALCCLDSFMGGTPCRAARLVSHDVDGHYWAKSYIGT